MRTTLILLSLFGLLVVTGCGGTVSTRVLDAKGRHVGTIRLESEHTAIITDEHGEVRGRVRGNLVRDAGSKKLGTIEQRDEHIVVIDANDDEVGSVEQEINCYGKSQALLGRISAKIDPEAAGAACLILLILE